MERISKKTKVKTIVKIFVEVKYLFQSKVI